jgi:hypothetical protein
MGASSRSSSAVLRSPFSDSSPENSSPVPAHQKTHACWIAITGTQLLLLLLLLLPRPDLTWD